MAGVTIKIPDLTKVKLKDLMGSSKTRKLLRDVLRSNGREIKRDIKRLTSSQLGRRSGRMRKDDSAAKVTAKVTPDRIDGRVGPLSPLHNIFEGGAKIPAQVIQPRRGVALRFGRRRPFGFVRGPVSVPARQVAARPVIAPAVANRTKPFNEDLAKALERALVEAMP